MSTRPDVPAPLMSATTVFLFTVTRTARQSTAVLEYDYDHENAKNESAVIYEQTAARFGPLYTTENTVACICVQIYSCLQKRRLPPGAGFSESRRPPGGRLISHAARRRDHLYRREDAPLERPLDRAAAQRVGPGPAC